MILRDTLAPLSVHWPGAPATTYGRHAGRRGVAAPVPAGYTGTIHMSGRAAPAAEHRYRADAVGGRVSAGHTTGPADRGGARPGHV